MKALLETSKSKENIFQKVYTGVVRFMMTFISVLLVSAIVLVGWLCVLSPGKIEPYRDQSGNVLQGSISQKIFVNIGGVEQGMFIRGKNSENPVLLFIHGGPGMPTFFLDEKYPTGLEDHFTICYWEQRGGGLSYRSDIPAQSITTEQLVSDAIEVTNYLRDRFDQEKIYLMGHSWGSYLGIQTAAQAPELFSAYIGMAQIANIVESERRAYAYMLDQYESTGNLSMVKKLKNYAVLDSDAATRSFFESALRDETMHELGIGTLHTMKSVITGIFLPVMQSKAYTLGEKVTIWRAKAFLSHDTILLDQLFSTDLSRKIEKLDIPTYFLSGVYDYTVNYDLSKSYLTQLKAPVKGHYTFEQSAHSPMFEESEKFIQIMVEDVLNNKTTLADKLISD